MGRVFPTYGSWCKKCLQKVLGNSRLSKDELLTVLVEIEGILNFRPLTYEYNEGETEMLTPSHVIFGRRIKLLPDVPVEEEVANETSCSRRFRHLSIRLAHFWKRWRNEYLTGLREYHKTGSHATDRKEIRVNDVVTLFEDNVKRGSWKTVIVKELIEGKDNIVRGAKIWVIRKGKPIRMSRPIQKLYPLEIRYKTERTKNAGVGNAEEQSEQMVKETMKRNVPRQAAAIAFEQKTREMARQGGRVL